MCLGLLNEYKALIQTNDITISSRHVATFSLKLAFRNLSIYLACKIYIRYKNIFLILFNIIVINLDN